MGKSEISGIEIPHDKGQYTLKHYLIGSMMPSFVKKILPKGIKEDNFWCIDALYLIEEAWNSHPHCLTVMTNGYLSKEKFKIIVESQYIDKDVATIYLIIS